MGKFRVVKQLIPVPSSSADPSWAVRDIYVAKLSGSSDKLWEFELETDAYRKMFELSGSDSTNRQYKIIKT